MRFCSRTRRSRAVRAGSADHGSKCGGVAMSCACVKPAAATASKAASASVRQTKPKVWAASRISEPPVAVIRKGPFDPAAQARGRQVREYLADVPFLDLRREGQGVAARPDVGVGGEPMQFGDHLLGRGDLADEVEDVRAVRLARQRRLKGRRYIVDINEAGRASIGEHIGHPFGGGAAGGRGTGRQSALATRAIDDVRTKADAREAVILPIGPSTALAGELERPVMRRWIRRVSVERPVDG